MSQAYADLCIVVGLVDKRGNNLYPLHDLRHKWNDECGRSGASEREKMAACGHRSLAVNVSHYQTVDAGRMQELVLKNQALGNIA